MMQHVLRFSATVVSAVLHPLLIPTYALVLLLLVNPYSFGVSSPGGRSMLIWQVLFMTFLLPMFVVFLMSMLQMVSSMYLVAREERIGPYIATGFFYVWVFINMKNNNLVPFPYVVFMLGAVIALFLTFFLNNFTKISAHASGMGGLIGFVLLGLTSWGYEYFWIDTGFLGVWELRLSRFFLLILLLSGMVGTARLLLEVHTGKQVAGGFLVGLASQYIAYVILSAEF